MLRGLGGERRVGIGAGGDVSSRGKEEGGRKMYWEKDAISKYWPEEHVVVEMITRNERPLVARKVAEVNPPACIVPDLSTTLR